MGQKNLFNIVKNPEKVGVEGLSSRNGAGFQSIDVKRKLP